MNYFCNLNAGIAQLVERNLAKVDVAGSSPVSRSLHLEKLIMVSYPSGLRGQSAKLLFIGSNPIDTSRESKKQI